MIKEGRRDTSEMNISDIEKSDHFIRLQIK